MKTVLDKATRDELTERILALNWDSKAQWGKMTLYQMLKHCTYWDEWMQGKRKYPRRSLLGRVVGRMALKSSLKDERPMMKNAITLPELMITEDGDIARQKEEWVAVMAGYEQLSNPGFVHFFFGKMTREEIGYFAYKHSDHHLRQFNG